ncbi:hypothetical protein Baya_8087 [Bagarius yarrelli]|uniref:BAAT/Acyl-CoA thioester hydrolase C-terminal domain-containing protein n=1 Tax=Bagarius yarrelli TaxID=175774 RepID=A0A556U491_BAGYA|nr:hypothetical protein Baya_8087 [Bagarius yarrelli]
MKERFEVRVQGLLPRVRVTRTEDGDFWEGFGHYMKQVMNQAGNSHLLTILSYPGAGHLIEAPYTPHCQASNFMLAGTWNCFVLT